MLLQSPIGLPGGAFFCPILLNFALMEGASNQLSTQPDPIIIQKQRVEAASEFLSICDRISNDYDSRYYWEDVQRALRIAAGLEKWPD